MQQAVLLVCAIPYVVLMIVGAPLWIWVVALVSGLVLVCWTDYALRRPKPDTHELTPAVTL